MTRYPMSDLEFDSFQKNGFIGPIKLYDPDEAQNIWKNIYFEMSTTRSQVFPMSRLNYDRHLDCELLAFHACNSRVVDRLQRLLGPDILCWRSEFFPRKPGSPGIEWHQVETWAYSNGSPELVPTVKREGFPTEVSVWTAWTHATRENSCLKFIPGSHRELHFDEHKEFRTFNPKLMETGFFGYSYFDKKIDPDWEPNEADAVYLEMNPGECVIFTERCMHGSTPNRTDETRYASSTRYVPCSTKVYPDMKEIHEHGETLLLDRYGTVLVAGQDEYKFNKVFSESCAGFRFPAPSVQVST